MARVVEAMIIFVCDVVVVVVVVGLDDNEK